MEKVRVVVAARALIIHNKSVLLVSHEKKLWYTPGGWLDGFENLNTTCKREVHEELGMEIEVGDIVHISHYKVLAKDNEPYYENVNKIEHYFLCTPKTMPQLYGENNLWTDEDSGLVKYAKWFNTETLSTNYGEYKIEPQWLKKCDWKFDKSIIFIEN